MYFFIVSIRKRKGVESRDASRATKKYLFVSFCFHNIIILCAFLSVLLLRIFFLVGNFFQSV